MTALPNVRTMDGTGMLRAAGILILIAGIATPIYAFGFQWALSIKAPPDIYVYGPGILAALAAGLFGLVGGVAFLIAFILLFVWNPGRGRQLIFFAPAVGAVLRVGSYVADGAVLLVIGVILSLLTVIAGFYVWRQRIFLQTGSLIFLLAMIVAQVPSLVQVSDPSDLMLFSVLEAGAGVGYLVCGLAMIRGARERSKLILSGAIAR
jgi:hypothetical protein